MAAADFDTAIRAFAKILDTSEDETRLLVEHLNTAAPMSNYCSKFASTLPVAKFFANSTENVIVAEKYVQGEMQHNIINETYGNLGTYNEVYVSKDKSKTYKIISIPFVLGGNNRAGYIENKLREVFIEAWIQTVLSCDPVYGDFVLPVQALYQGQFKYNATALHIYIQTSSIKNTLLSKIKEHILETKVPFEYMELRPTCRGLSQALLHFEKTYGFYHRNLHSDNIVFPAVKSFKKPRLSSFRLSCMTFNGFTYFHQSQPCKSNDMLGLLVELRDLHSNIKLRQEISFGDTLVQFIDGALKTNSESGHTIYDYLKHMFVSKNIPLRETVHTTQLVPGKPVYNYLLGKNAFPLPNLETLELFLSYIENFDKTFIELHESPMYRRIYGPEYSNLIVSQLRKTTTRERKPLRRQDGKRHLIGGRHTHRRKRTRKN
jgi:hypothetical protein